MLLFQNECLVYREVRRYGRDDEKHDIKCKGLQNLSLVSFKARVNSREPRTSYSIIEADQHVPTCLFVTSVTYHSRNV